MGSSGIIICLWDPRACLVSSVVISLDVLNCHFLFATNLSRMSDLGITKCEIMYALVTTVTVLLIFKIGFGG